MRARVTNREGAITSRITRLDAAARLREDFDCWGTIIPLTLTVVLWPAVFLFASMLAYFLGVVTFLAFGATFWHDFMRGVAAFGMALSGVFALIYATRLHWRWLAWIALGAAFNLATSRWRQMTSLWEDIQLTAGLENIAPLALVADRLSDRGFDVSNMLITPFLILVGVLAAYFLVAFVLFLARLLIAERDSVASARYFLPLAPWAAVKAFLGIPPSGYLGAGVGFWSLLLLFAGRGFIAFGVFLLLLIPLDLMIWSSGMGAMAAADGQPVMNSDIPMANVMGSVALATMIVFCLGWSAVLFARRLRTRSYERSREIDPRKPILFLRPFRDDRVALAPPRRGPLSFLARPLEEPKTLDEAVLQLAGAYGPVVAIGNPNDRIPPFGAARRYVRGEDWRSVVASLAQEAQAVIVCLDQTEGVRWEVEHMLSAGHAAKSLFVLHPALVGVAKAGELARFGVTGPPADLERVVAVRADPSGPGAFVARRQTASVYRVAVQRGLLEILNYPPASVARPQLARREHRPGHERA